MDGSSPLDAAMLAKSLHKTCQFSDIPIPGFAWLSIPNSKLAPINRHTLFAIETAIETAKPGTCLLEQS